MVRRSPGHLRPVPTTAQAQHAHTLSTGAHPQHARALIQHPRSSTYTLKCRLRAPPQGNAAETQQRVLVNTLYKLMTPVLPPFYRIFMGGIVPSR